MTFKMASGAHRPARPNHLKLRRTSSCSALQVTGAFSLSSAVAVAKPEIPSLIEDRQEPKIQIIEEEGSPDDDDVWCQKKKARSLLIAPEINVSCEEVDNNPAASSMHIRKRCPGMRSGSAPEPMQSSNRLTVPILPMRDGVEHISHLVVPDPPCHFCCEPNSKPVHEDCTRLKIVSRGNLRSLGI